EHCSIAPPDLQERLARLNAVVVTQPGFVYYSGERYLRQVPREDVPWLYPIGSLMKRGARVAGSSDSPVAPPNPMVAVYAAVTRRASSGEVVGASEKIPAPDALKVYTMEGACAACEEKDKGSISPGKLADLVILSDDPTRVPTEAIKDIEVRATILGGKVVWQKD
ncbi:MAG: amidohydrolase family protein, partial [Dehalococcoidia bacterium]